MTITATFTLAGLLLFSLAVAVMDSIRALAREIEEAEKHFGHDRSIFPDHEP